MMLTVCAASRAGGSSPNEDFYATTDDTVIVLDGLTSRTDSGCIHGVPWYVEQLAVNFLASTESALRSALRDAIEVTAATHRDSCDLSHPGTPAAAVAAVRVSPATTEYLVLADVTVALEQGKVLHVVTDNRISATAPQERADADRFPIGTDEKDAALVRVKHAELAVRNKRNGYWTAAADSNAAQHAIIGRLDTAQLSRFVVATDGVGRIVDAFGKTDWSGVVQLAAAEGCESVIDAVRRFEEADPSGLLWPRNKASDDATLLLAVLQR